MLRLFLSRFFKDDINPDYGIYSEGGDVVMEMVDQNTEYEQQVAGGEETLGRQISDYENWEDEYDRMYDKTD